MRAIRACVGFLAAWAVAGAACAHVLRHDVRVDEAVVVVHFPDGEPSALERHEPFRGTGAEPVQSGLTGAQGRLVLLPGAGSAAGGRRPRAFPADGHGIDAPLAFERHDGVASAAAPAEPGWKRVAWGVGLVLALGALARRLLQRRGRA